MQAEETVPETLAPAVDYDVKLLHPAFSSPDADVILGTDGAMFRVHSYTLRTTSGWFRSMFSLPQTSPTSNPNAPATTQNEIIYMEEDSKTLELVLRIICGLPVPQVDSYDMIDALLFAAEKYDIPAVMSIVRIMVMTPTLLSEPFRLYIVACRFGWDHEAKLASTQTLSYNLLDKEMRPLLQRLSANALLDLLELHRTRREGLRQRLNEPPFVAGGTASCSSCNGLIDYHTWRELKYKIILEMDARPLGDTVLEHGLLSWPEAHACWSAKCPNKDCDRFLYDKAETIRVISDCIKSLPKSI
ncbi:BTB domain-containing protein [Pleurotus pulmonarius]|nr:hypothetical protein EYR38_006822 [Pleurotus pulmonarius]